MKITVKCFATLAKFQPENHEAYEAPDGFTIQQLVDTLGIDDAEVKITFVNGVHAKRETELKDGDRIGLFPAVGGG